MLHDGDCEKLKVVDALHLKFRLSGTEKLNLMTDTVVELCFCWDRATIFHFEPTFQQMKERANRGMGIVLEGRGGGVIRHTSITWEDRKVEALLQARGGQVEPEAQIIQVDFRKRKRM